MDDYQVSRNYPLFEHMADQHDLTLLEDELWQIERIVLKMHGIDPEKCTMNPQQNPQQNPHDSRTVDEQLQHQVQQKGNQLDQVYGSMKEEIEIATELETSINGWQRVKVDFTVEVKPRWWQFWKQKIDAQDFQWSAWLKPNGQAFLYQPQIEKK